MINIYKIRYQMVGVFFLIAFFQPREEDPMIKKALFFGVMLMFLIYIIIHIISSIKKKSTDK